MAKTYEELAGKLYPYYYVQCAICKSEEPVGDQTRERAVARLRTTGWKLTKRGYVCSACQKGK